MRHKVIEFVKEIFIDVLGSIIYGMGIVTFAYNASFATGGISGIALTLKHLFSLPIGLVIITLNIPVAILSLKTLGKKYILRSVRSMAVSSLLIDYVIPLLPTYKGERLVASIYTGILMGIGLSFFYGNKSSTGGTDFIILSLKKKYPHVSIGMFTFIIDGIIISLGSVAIGNIDAAIYGLIATVVSTIVMDKIMYGINSGKFVFIISDNGKAIADNISKSIKRGATLVNARGAFTEDRREVLLCACSKNQINELKKSAYSADSGAFIIITESNEVFGQGFNDYE